MAAFPGSFIIGSKAAIELMRTHAQSNRPLGGILQSACFDGLPVEVSQVGKKALKVFLQLVIPDVLLGRIPF